ncbi:NAD-dependent epimerase/dehydratase family protein [Cryobacterium shii]|uniref:NAD-dependent epimerase/dehydratase family protein n=1 Tax=Cryobacterium shii TaxID=1259235 RepID=A0AAQ2HFP1_9MICO|nr:NAD-dependent epimerase/dehydratase family protein [Cryobacterium shii]TFC47187.1 NAD-dependent epimerase/dehydratase family protein [Cryobacterium shii]
MTSYEWAAVLAALCISLVSPFAIRPLLEKLHVVDVPNARSSHAATVLRGGGVAPLFGLSAGFLTLLITSEASGGKPQLLIVFLGSVAIGLVGLLEDLWGVRIAVRAGAQLLIGALGTSALVIVSTTEWWWVPIGAIGFAGYTNVANFMDGINGISGLHGIAVGLAFSAIGAMSDVRWLLPIGLAFAVSFGAFLPWNLRRNRLFLGDVGSYLLGGCISLIALAAAFEGAPVVALLSPLAIYLADAGSTLAARIFRGDDWKQAHRSHTYQKLTDTGLSHLRVALIATAATIVSTAFGLLACNASDSSLALAIVGIAVTSATYLALPKFRGWTAAPAALGDLGPTDVTVRPLNEAALGGAKWAVVGASGFIGAALVAELRAQGHDVVDVVAPRLVLNPKGTARDAIEYLARSAEAVDGLAAACDGADVVVNAAGLALPGSAASDSLSGANALLPLVVLRAAERVKATRVVHLSSAAVQGRRRVLDESLETSPFSPYSHSKALGEAALRLYVAKGPVGELPSLVIIRATSVQGVGRQTTAQLQRLARSPFASVARPGDAPTVVSSLRGLVEFVVQVGKYAGDVPITVLQPWEGMTTSSVLEIAGGHAPLKVPVWACRSLVTIGFLIGGVLEPVNGVVRRVELMWFGQKQNAKWARSVGLEGPSYVHDVLFSLPNDHEPAAHPRADEALRGRDAWAGSS